VTRAALAAALGALTVSALAALGPRYGGQLRVGVLDLPGSLAPARPCGLGERLVLGLVHEPLLRYSPDGRLLPGLVDRWTASADGRAWTLHLRDGASFHDGTPVTAQDLERTLRRFVRSPSVAARHLQRSLAPPTDPAATDADQLGLLAPSSQELVLRVNADVSEPLAALASPAAAVTSASGSGAGPFAPTLWTPARRLDAAAFGAHGRGRPFLDRIEVSAFASQEALDEAYRAGRVDLIPTDTAPGAANAVLLLVLDPTQPPFDVVANRVAARASLDRPERLGPLTPAADTRRLLLPPVVLPATGTEPAASDEPTRGSGAVELVVSTDVKPLLSQRIVALLAATGFSVRVRPLAPAQALAAPGAARLLLWFPEIPEPSIALEELHSLAPAPEAAVRALADARAAVDPDRRRVLLLESAEATQRAGLLLPLANLPISFGERAGLHGAATDAKGQLLLEDAWREP